MLFLRNMAPPSARNFCANSCEAALEDGGSEDVDNDDDETREEDICESDDETVLIVEIGSEHSFQIDSGFSPLNKKYMISNNTSDH